VRRVARADLLNRPPKPFYPHEAPRRIVRLHPILFVSIIVALSGCLGGVAGPGTGASLGPEVLVQDADGHPIPFAQLSVVASGLVVSAASANELGAFVAVPPLPAGAMYAVGASGYAAVHFAAAPLPHTITLATMAGSTAGPFLRWLPPLDLVCPSIDPPPYSCDRFGEPVLEVAGDGTIWASATSAVGRSPPIWTSRDGGASFQLLEGKGTGLVRDATGIEGDFAIDEAGNVYFFDILAGAAYFTSYAADGTHRWTSPHAWKPLVDRPWVRAGAADQVWVLYNTGTSSIILSSTDGGRTFDLLGSHEFPCGLATLGQHPTLRDHLYVAATTCGDAPMLWTSVDGGKTWDEGQAVPLPAGQYERRLIDTFLVPAVDEAGNVYLVYPHALFKPETDGVSSSREQALFLARRGPEGSWSNAVQIAPPAPAYSVWPAAGQAGHVGLAWYQASGRVEDNESQWRLFTAASVDADADAPHFQVAVADPDVLAEGPLGRQLGDFLESRLTPDGRLAVVYAKQVGRDDAFQPASSQDDQVRFVLSQPSLDLAPSLFLNGPQPR